MTILMCKRNYLYQYEIFAQIPFLIVWSLCFHGLCQFVEKKPLDHRWLWARPVAIATAFLLMLTAYTRTYSIYNNYQDDAALPVRDYTLIFLYDHDAHTKGYLDAMKLHYRNREEFAQNLEQFLRDPANRY